MPDWASTESRLLAMASAMSRIENLWQLCGGDAGLARPGISVSPQARQTIENARKELTQARLVWQATAAQKLRSWATEVGAEPGSCIAINTTRTLAPVLVYASVNRVSLHERSFLGVAVAALHLARIQLDDGDGGLIEQTDANFAEQFYSSGLVSLSPVQGSDSVFCTDERYCPDTGAPIKRIRLLLPLQKSVRDSLALSGQLRVSPSLAREICLDY